MQTYCGQYLRDCEYRAEFLTCHVDNSYQEAAEFIIEQIDKNLPVIDWMLRHQNKEFRDLNWHWFCVTGKKIGLPSS